MTASAVSPAPEQIVELCRLFRAQQMQKPLWTHQAHLIVSTDILFELGAERGGALIRALIPLNNSHMGIPNSDTRGYHETITTLFIDAIVPLIADPPCRDRDEAIARVLNSPLAERNYALRFYTSERLWSPAARRAFVPPDLG